MLKFTIVSLALTASIFAVTSAEISEADKEAIRGAAIPLFLECSQEFSISQEEIMAAKDKLNVDALNACFYKCLMKKFGVLTDDGLFDGAAAIEKGSKVLGGEENLKKIQEAVNTCSAVNDEPISEPEGCERAKLFISCFIKQRNDFLAF